MIISVDNVLALLGVLGALLAPTVATVVSSMFANNNAAKARKATQNVATTLAATSVETQAKLGDVASTLAGTSAQTVAKLDEIHILVNSRLTKALEKIDRLEARLYEMTGETPTGEPPRIIPPEAPVP